MSHDPAKFELVSEPPEAVEKGRAGVVGSGALLGVSSFDLRNCDCMDLMRGFPDKHFDLAIVDPPYGIGQDVCHTGTKHLKGPMWDKEIPPPNYFKELARVSREQIIWGGNYFPMRCSRGWIVWDKRPMPPTYASCELAWTSFDRNAATWSGKTGYETPVADRIHPTQKPVALYSWLLENWAKPGQRVLDTHLGSGSHAIACHYFGAHLTASEIDADYFKAATERIKRETAQETFDLAA
jgi:site-specific DNA-methyltransferase (adenine-specific)